MAPGGHCPAFGNVQADGKTEPGHFHHAGEIPGGIVLIGRLVVVPAVVLFEDLFAIASGLAGELGAHADGKGGDAGAGESKVVGAVEMARFGMGIGLDGEAIALSHIFDDRPDGGALGSGDNDIGGAAEGVECVEIEVEGGRSGGNEGVRGVVFGSAQAVLFRGDEEEEGRAARFVGRACQARAISRTMPQPVALSTAPL